MFVEKSAINNILSCKVCESQLKDPRLLPCGISVCAECVKDLCDANKELIKCQSCGKTHEIPRDGFPENKGLSELAKVKSNEISRCNKIAEIKSILEKISEKSLKIESGLEIGETTIRNKYDKARNDVQLTIEEAHLELDKFHRTFMDEIDAHEKECQRHLKTLQAIKTNEYEKILVKTKEFKEKSIHFLDKNELEEKHLEVMLSDGKKLLRTLQKVDDRLETNILNNKNIHFAKNIQKSNIKSLGEIKIDEIQPRFGKNDATLNQIELQECLNDCNLRQIDDLTFCFLENGNIFVAYLNMDLRVNICLFNRQGVILKKIKEFSKVNKNCLESASINDKIFLLVGINNNEFGISRIGLDLIVEKRVKFSGVGMHKMFATDYEILTYDVMDNIIQCIDLIELEKKESETVITCENSEDVTSFFEFDENYVVARRGKVTLGDIYEYGREWSRFEIEYSADSPKCFPYLKNCIVAHEDSIKKVYFYDIYESGRIVDEASLERLPPKVKFVGTNKEMLFFFDKNDKKIYFF